MQRFADSYGYLQKKKKASKYPQLFVRVNFYIFWRRNYMFPPKKNGFAHACRDHLKSD